MLRIPNRLRRALSANWRSSVALRPALTASRHATTTSQNAAESSQSKAACSNGHDNGWKKKYKFRRVAAEQSRIAEEKAVERRKQVLQFSRHPPSRHRNVDASPGLEEMIRLCDQAIIISRQTLSLDLARVKLIRASRLFNRIVNDEKAKGMGVRDLTYEVYLLRSGWNQVVRGTLALLGEQATVICTRMMIDYLRWEKALLLARLPLQDGTEEPSPVPQFDLKGKTVKEFEDKQYFYGPFVQDTAPVLHDLFVSLTSPSPSFHFSKRPLKDDLGTRAFETHERYLLASSLWKAIAEFPSDTWKRPMTLEWMRLGDRSTLEDGQEMIASGMLICSDTLRVSGRLEQSILLWQACTLVCEGGQESYASKMLERIVSCLTGTRSTLLGQDSNGAVVDARTYLKSLGLLARILAQGWYKGPFGSVCRQRAGEKLLREFISVDEWKNWRSAKTNAFDPINLQSLARNVAHDLRTWVETWFSKDGKGGKGSMPDIRNLTTLNRLVWKVNSGSPRVPRRPETVKKLLLEMVRNPDLPSPDETTIAAILPGADRNTQGRLMTTLLDMAKNRVVEEVQSDWQEVNDEQPSSPLVRENTARSEIISDAPLLQLAADALDRGDLTRMLHLINTAKKEPSILQQSLPNDGKGSLSRLVFFMYPSLDRRIRHRRRMRQSTQLGTFSKKRIPLSNSVAFHPKVLVSVLYLLANAGRTGLAERVWRMIKRASKRSGMKESGIGWPIPIRAYTIMFSLYATEVERAEKMRTRRNVGGYSRLSRNLSAGIRSGLSTSSHYASSRDGLVRGWAKPRYGIRGSRQVDPPLLLDRGKAARLIARQEYQELRERWKQGTAETPTDKFWICFLSIFRYKGKSNAPFELDSRVDSVFLQTVRQDIDPVSALYCTIPPLLEQREERSHM